MVNLLHAPLVLGLGNLPSSIGSFDAHSMDDSPQVPSQLQKPILLALRTCSNENVFALPHQLGYLAERFDCIKVSKRTTTYSLESRRALMVITCANRWYRYRGPENGHREGKWSVKVISC